MKAVYVRSYAHATRLGLKPFDSLTSTVAIPTKKPKIVAFTASHTFLIKDRGKYTVGKLSQFVDRYGGSYYATTRPMLDILLRVLFNRKPKVQKVTYR